MSYSELIKRFDRVRGYMREFYVYGFKRREEYTQKSARAYDDERRRLESWLKDYMRFRQDADGKRVFLSIDSRAVRRNPLYAAWKAKSFTDGDITLHFLLFDILNDPDTALTLSELMEKIDDALSRFDVSLTFDPSTVRKKLKEYADEGIIVMEKKGSAVRYRRAADTPLPSADALDFFSEAAPCGVIGSTLLDKLPPNESRFAFKHHYITSAMDSEVLCALFEAMSEKRAVTLTLNNRRKAGTHSFEAVPLRVMLSAQSGRQYLMAYTPRNRRVTSYRLDTILSVKAGAVCERFDALRERLNGMAPHLFGVSTQSRSGDRLERIAFTVQYAPDEAHIPKRLEREKRCGTVTRLDDHTCAFEAEVYDASELIPWVRTFICRITHFECSDRALEAQFHDDLTRMYALYGLEGGEDR